jgi:hypothetical protein
MQLSELLTSLSVGVLQNLAVGGDGSGEIPAKYRSRVVSAINQGIVALYARFNLLEKEVIVRAYDSQTIYPLKRIYADTNTTTVPRKFITDTVAAPFEEDVIKILEAYDEIGNQLLMNDPSEECMLFTPSLTTLQITKPVTGNSYFLIYQAHHPKLSSSPTQEISVPLVLQEALEFYVAYKILSAMNGQEHAAKAVEHFANYERICAEAKDMDSIGISLTSETSKLTERGWV